MGSSKVNNHGRVLIILECRKDKELQRVVSVVFPKRRSSQDTHIVGCSNSNAILKGMPAHVQYLLVEIDCIGIRLLAHSASLTRRAVGPAVALLVLGSIHRCGNSNLLGLERALIGLQYHFGVFARF